MLEFNNVTKTYPLEHGKKKVIFENISFVFPEGKNVALLGANGAGKSTTLRLIAGSDYPDSGQIIRTKRISWPLGFVGGFHGNLTGEENLRFISRIYGADLKAVKAYVEEFSELGEYLYQPIKTYSSGMRARLAFGLSLAIKFEVYLIDELTGVGDAKFRNKSMQAFEELRSKANLIMASHSMPTLREYCDIAILLKDGVLRVYENIEEGIAEYLGPESRFIGGIGNLIDNTLYGWIINKFIDDPVKIDIWLNDVFIDNCVANVYRKDLEQQGIKHDGIAGFAYKFESIKRGDIVRCFISGTSIEINNSPRICGDIFV